MSIETYGAFIVAASIVLVLPGPTIILVVSYSASQGRRAVMPLVAGVTLGDFTAMILSILGLGAILSTSATLFSILRWIGAIYLIYLGIKLWLSTPQPRSVISPTTATSNRRLFTSAFIVTSLNPKSIVFFVAFLPQFIDRSAAIGFQLILMGTTFLILAAVNATLYGFFAGQLRDMLKQGTVLRWYNRCGGSALIGAGIFTAAFQRSS